MTGEDDPKVIGKNTYTFKGAYRRAYLKEHKVNKDMKFHELLASFSQWGTNKWIGSRKQMKALAIEARLDGIQSFIIAEEYRNKKNEPKTRYRDIFAGSFRSKEDYETFNEREIRFYRDEKGRYRKKRENES